MSQGKRGRKQIYSDEHLLQYLRFLKRASGRVPTVRMANERSVAGLGPSSTIIRRRFGSWTAALRLAFGEDVLVPTAEPRLGTAKLVDDLLRVTEELGRVPARMEVEARRDMSSARTYIRRWGSWSAAVEEIMVRTGNEHWLETPAD